MKLQQKVRNRGILVIDDNQAIHDDFAKILCGDSDSSVHLDENRRLLFGESPALRSAPRYEIQTACDGLTGLNAVKEALDEERPFALAFVDVRMPSKWDGIETIRRLWEVDPDLQVVICTAYLDYSWEEIVEQLGVTDQLLILKKPFDKIEVLQIALALTEKWHLSRNTAQTVCELI